MMQKLIIFLALSFTGAGFYFGGTHTRDRFTFFDPEQRVVKKISVVKPKNFYSDRGTFRGLSAYENEKFSFFRVLNDPSMNEILGLNGEIFKINQFPTVKTSPEKVPLKEPVPPIRVGKNDAYKAVPTIKSFKIKKTFSHQKRAPVDLKRAESRRVIDRPFPTILSFVIQVSSFRQLELAEALRGILAKKGYASFIGKTELPNNKGTWYRVYIGRYLDRAGAELAAAKYQREEKLRAMVIRQSG